jgi:hypothetical protein
MTRTAIIIALLLLACVADALSGAAVQPGGNLQSAVSAGGTIQLAAGTFTFSTPITVGSNTTIIGLPGFGSHLVFNLPGQDWGFHIAANASNVTIQGLSVTSNGGFVKMMDGSGYSSIRITDNSIQWIGAGAADLQCIADTVPCSNPQVTHNTFHDSMGADRAIDFYTTLGGNFDYNLFSNVNAGIHLSSPGPNVSASYNYGTGLGNGKLVEAGIVNSPGSRFDGNVVYGWSNSGTNAMGLSIVCVSGYSTTGNNVDISSNYANVNAAGSSPVGNAFEIGGAPLNFSNNIGACQNAPAVAAICTTGGTGTGNRLFGPSATAGIAGEPSSRSGFGSWSGEAPTINTNYAAASVPPPNTFAGVNFFPGGNGAAVQGGTPPATQPALSITAIPTNNGVTLTWPTQLTGISITTKSGDPAGIVTDAGPSNGAMLVNLNGGWGYTCVVTGIQNGTTVTGSISFTTTGHSTDGTLPTIAQLLLPAASQPTSQPSGSIVVSTAGATIQNLSVTGTIEVKAPNVTIQNVSVNANGQQPAIQIDPTATGCVVQNSDVYGTAGSGYAIVNNAEGPTFLNLNIHDCGASGMDLSGGTTVKNCIFQRLGWNAAGITSNPLISAFTGGEHTQDIFIVNGSSFVLNGNTFADPAYSSANGINYGLSTAAIIAQPYKASPPNVIGHLTISNNTFSSTGSGSLNNYSMYLEGQGSVSVTNNTLPNSQAVYPSYISPIDAWSGNHDTAGNIVGSPAAPTTAPVVTTQPTITSITIQRSDGTQQVIAP